MTYNEIKARLIASGIERDEARSDVMGLVGFIYSFTPAQIMARPDFDYGGAELEAAIKKRCGREPLSYITGTRGFMGLDICVTSEYGNTLIPRPETEIIAEYLISHLPENGRFADLCCGSGCIGVSVCSHRGDVSGVCADISAAAVAVTKKNIGVYGVADRLEVVRCDIRDGDALHSSCSIRDGGALQGCCNTRDGGVLQGCFDIIAANPPYLTGDEMRLIPSELTFEPALALDGGADGLDLVRALVNLYPPMLKPHGEMLIEIGSLQGRASLEIAKNAGLRAEILKDYASLDRVLHIMI